MSANGVLQVPIDAAVAASSAERMTVIVTLGGPVGSGKERIRAGCVLHDRLRHDGVQAVLVFSSYGGLNTAQAQAQKIAWVTGDEIGPAVPRPAFVLEPRATTTVQNAVFCQPNSLQGLLPQGLQTEIGRIIVITSDFHMPRTRRLFEQAQRQTHGAYELVFHPIPNPPHDQWKNLPHANGAEGDAAMAAELQYEREQLPLDERALSASLATEHQRLGCIGATSAAMRK
jgi:hypothetical protein